MTEQKAAQEPLDSTASNSTDLLCVGDNVRIVKCGAVDGDFRYRWIPEMDQYNGKETTVINVEQFSVEDEEPHAYELAIDSGEHGYLHHWLEKVNT